MVLLILLKPVDGAHIRIQKQKLPPSTMPTSLRWFDTNKSAAGSSFRVVAQIGSSSYEAGSSPLLKWGQATKGSRAL